MATTIKLKNSVTTTNAPSSLVQGEVAINITDKKVWVGNAATTPIQLLGAGASINLTSLTTSNDCSISGLTVGKGAGSVASNTVVGSGALASNSTGFENTAFGLNTLANTTGNDNTAIGWNSLLANTSGAGNVGLGGASLRFNTTANYNTSVGYLSTYTNTTGASNSSLGFSALYYNTTGSNNTAIGASALQSNTTASNNTAVGYQAAYSNTTGVYLTALGYQALYSSTGSYNTAVGMTTLRSNTTGTNNTAIGGGDTSSTYPTLYSNTTGSYNTAVGNNALGQNTTASNNTAVGYQAGYSNTTGTDNVFIGKGAGISNTTNSYSTYVGTIAGGLTTGTFNTFIGRASGYDMTTGTKNTILGCFGGNQDGLDIRTASNYAIISDGDGNRLLSTYNGGTLALDGGAVPQSGTGITFPATQSASSNANTLDDYEEGTWTPTIIGTTTAGTASYAAQNGRYTKIGRMVYIELYVAYSSGTGTGTLQIDGLPFTTSNSATYPSCAISFFNNIGLTANNFVMAYIGNASTKITIVQCPVGGGANTSVAYDGDGDIQISACYTV